MGTLCMVRALHWIRVRRAGQNRVGSAGLGVGDRIDCVDCQFVDAGGSSRFVLSALVGCVVVDRRGGVGSRSGYVRHEWDVGLCTAGGRVAGCGSGFAARSLDGRGSHVERACCQAACDSAGMERRVCSSEYSALGTPHGSLEGGLRSDGGGGRTVCGVPAVDRRIGTSERTWMIRGPPIHAREHLRDVGRTPAAGVVCHRVSLTRSAAGQPADCSASCPT